MMDDASDAFLYLLEVTKKREGKINFMKITVFAGWYLIR